MARSQAGLILLPDGATYQDAIESSIARELAEQRRAADAAALAKAKPKGPPPHLVGTEIGQPFGAQLGGQQLAPEVTSSSSGASGSAPTRGHDTGGDYAALLLSGPFVYALGVYVVDFDSSGAFGILCGRRPIDGVCWSGSTAAFALPAGRQGGPGRIRHQEPESPPTAGTQRLGRLPVPAPRTGGGSPTQGDPLLRPRVDG